MAMQWDNLLSTKRLGLETLMGQEDPTRTPFQRDYDRLIFASPFRRLQNKTQVFPLPGNVFVHNRLTHSLEVASVGRSLGNLVAGKLHKAGFLENPFLLQEIGSVVGAAALGHDLGNPPFGHSGEKAIQKFFSEDEGKQYVGALTIEEWQDMIKFEGNANAFRLLTHQFKGRRAGGFNLTYATLATIVKYPCEAMEGNNKAYVNQKKFGFFQSEKADFENITKELGLTTTQTNPFITCRHPLVYLVEAADDICYQVIDLEDAHRLGILVTPTAKEYLLNFFVENEKKEIESVFQTVYDANEQIAYLRARVIGKLTKTCADIFWENHYAILEGNFNNSLTDLLPEPLNEAMEAIKSMSVPTIYNHRSVNEVELAGYHVLGGLLAEFIPAILEESTDYHKKLLQLMPAQYTPQTHSAYHKIQSVIDFVSGMTDTYALELFRRIRGISLPAIYQ